MISSFCHVANTFDSEAFPFGTTTIFIFGGVIGAIVLIIVMLVDPAGRELPANMDRLLHRGRYAVEGEVGPLPTGRRTFWNMLGMGAEFTRRDRAIYLGAMLKATLLFGFFAVALVVNLQRDVSFDFWMAFWMAFVHVFTLLALLFTIWFTIGGILDMRFLYRTLKQDDRDQQDDGTVVHLEPGTCVQCGYDLRGNLDVVACPECGASTAAPAGQ